jgi:hypothetical protein
MASLSPYSHVCCVHCASPVSVTHVTPLPDSDRPHLAKLDVRFVILAPVERHASENWHPVLMARLLDSRLRGNDARPQELAMYLRNGHLDVHFVSPSPVFHLVNPLGWPSKPPAKLAG